MATIQGVYVALFGRPADPAGLTYFNGITNNGANLSSIASLAGTKEYTDRFAGQSNVAIVNAIYQSLFNRDAETAGLNFFVDALNKGTLNINNVAIAILDGAQGTDKTTVTNKLTAADNFTKALDTPVEIGAYVGTNAAAAGRAFLTPVTSSAATIPTAAATDAAIANVASVSTGGVTLSDASVLLSATISPTATDAKLKTTSGDDTIVIATPASAVSASAGSIDGGFGTDTVKFVTAGTAAVTATNGTTSTFNVTPTLTNVEKVVITAVAGGDDAAGGGNGGVGGDGTVSLDLSKALTVKDVLVDTVTVGAANGGTVGSAAVSVSNITVGAKLGLKGGIADTVSLAYKAADVTGGADAATLSLEKALVADAKAVTIDAIETFNIAVNGTSSIKSADFSDAKTITVTGSGDLALGGGAATDLKKVATFDSTALSGKVTLSIADGTVALKVTGTNNADAITLSSATTTGDASKDVIVYNKAEASNYALSEVVTNFQAANDKIDLKAFSFTKTGLVNLTNIQDNAAVFASSSVAYIQVADGGGTSTWVFADSNGDGKLNTASDFAVKLAGAVNLTDANFTLA